MILISTHNTGVYEEIGKIIIKYHQITSNLLSYVIWMLLQIKLYIKMQFIGTHKICHRCSTILHKIGLRASMSRSVSNWTSKEVRTAFLDFFCSKYDHKFVPSSSVIPKKGDGTYFTNAGMNQVSFLQW